MVLWFGGAVVLLNCCALGASPPPPPRDHPCPSPVFFGREPHVRWAPPRANLESMRTAKEWTRTSRGDCVMRCRDLTAQQLPYSYNNG